MKPDFSYKLTSKVSNYINDNNMIGDAEFVVVGLSGGADSVCLFLLLNKIKKSMGFSLHAIHINHGIRGESAQRDEQFSKELCEKYDVPFTSYHIDVPKEAKSKGLTLEEAGRNVRYQCFSEYARKLKKAKIAVAHHMDDQAETVLFNMVRGSGITGIGGIKPVNKKDDITVIRPMLCLTREEIEKYLECENQDFCIDETNLENEYSRNTIRNEVMPIFNSFQPKTSEHISNMAEDAREVQEYIDSVVEKLYSEYVESEEGTYCIKVKPLKEEKPYIVKQLIILVLRQMIETYKDITKTHINDIYSLFEKGSGKQIVLPYSLLAKREKEYIKISKR